MIVNTLLIFGELLPQSLPLTLWGGGGGYDHQKKMEKRVLAVIIEAANMSNINRYPQS